LSGYDTQASYVLFPGIGLAILVDSTFSLYVHKHHRNKGVATELTNAFLDLFPALLRASGVQTQEPTTKIINKSINNR
jgi:GNAT superfamily N-acetyltransferase